MKYYRLINSRFFKNISGSISQIQADPYHGFIFWIENNKRLVQIEKLCQKQEEEGEEKYHRNVLIDNNQNQLGNFLILFEQFKLQIADLTENTLLELELASSQRSGSSTPNIM